MRCSRTKGFAGPPSTSLSNGKRNAAVRGGTSEGDGSTTNCKPREPMKDREERQQGRRRPLARPSHWSLKNYKDWSDDRREQGGSKRGCPVTEERDERSEKVRITLSFLIFSAVYNLQRVRYGQTHVPGGGPHRDNGSGRGDTPDIRKSPIGGTRRKYPSFTFSRINDGEIQELRYFTEKYCRFQKMNEEISLGGGSTPILLVIRVTNRI